MITDLEKLSREEIISYICYIYCYFYNTYDNLLDSEKEYINDFIKLLDVGYRGDYGVQKNK